MTSTTKKMLRNAFYGGVNPSANQRAILPDDAFDMTRSAYTALASNSLVVGSVKTNTMLDNYNSIALYQRRQIFSYHKWSKI